MEAFRGRYVRTSEVQYEDFLKALGVSFLQRRAAMASSPTTEVTREAGLWTITTATILKAVSLTFTLGEEFDDVTPDGRDTMSLVTLEEGRVVTVQRAKVAGERSTRSTLELVGGELVYTILVEEEPGVTCVQTFRRVH